VPDDPTAIQLVVSELVTNAVVHGSPPVVLECAIRHSGFSVTVRDGGVEQASPPANRAQADRDEFGRGLHLVSALAASFHVDIGPSGTTAMAVVSW
jgi:anti-sigma regulatory factor (Ser/Thr protein kinase)